MQGLAGRNPTACRHPASIHRKLFFRRKMSSASLRAPEGRGIMIPVVKIKVLKARLKDVCCGSWRWRSDAGGSAASSPTAPPAPACRSVAQKLRVAGNHLAAFSRLSFKLTLKMALCRVAFPCGRWFCLNDCDWKRDPKTAVAFTGAADATVAAGALHGRIQQMKGTL